MRANSLIYRHLLLSLLLLLVTQPALAARIEEQLPNGLYVTADYRPGSTGRPAILLLHGFLTVHDFSLIQKIADELGDNDYTVLAPTLSLGISERRQTLACDALHLHALEDDINELEWWTRWLIDKGHQNIILIGHSSGSLQLVKLANLDRFPQISRMIGISMIPQEGTNILKFEQSIKQAHTMLADGNNSIGKFTVAYCEDNYRSPARQFLSYVDLQGTALIKDLKRDTLNTTVILGSEDVDANPEWFQTLQSLGLDVIVINGANHFFNRGHEFELFESLIDTLEEE
jgi:esterase/lipase